jgi:hypothetical protein
VPILPIPRGYNFPDRRGGATVQMWYRLRFQPIAEACLPRGRLGTTA